MSSSNGNWNGHLFSLEGRKCLAFLDKETLYSFVIFNILKGDLKDFKTIFVDSFIKQLKIDKLLSLSNETIIRGSFQNFELSTTDNDMKTIGYLNDCIARIKWSFDDQPPTIERAKRYVETDYNRVPILHKNCSSPFELMTEKLKAIV